MNLPVILLLLLSSPLAAYKILVYNIRFGHSHSNFLGRIADELAEAGHDVTSLIPIVDMNITDGTTKSRIIRSPSNPDSLKMMGTWNSGTVDFWEEDTAGPLSTIMLGHILSGIFCPQCETTLAHPGLIEQLKAEKYDVFINENFDFCGTGLSHLIEAKSMIVVSTTTLFDNVAYQLGIPVLPSINPSFVMDDFDIESIWSRAKNVIATHTNNLMWDPTLRCNEATFRRKFGEDFPSIDDLTAKASFVLTNSEPFIDFARPLLRKVVDLGGLGVKPPKPIEPHWNSVLSLRPMNVLVSFGSMAKSMNMLPIRKAALLKTFAAFPNVTFIWKYENPNDDFATNEVPKTPNVVVTKWMAQTDLLNDPRMTAFISHGGMGSCQEAANRGVPGLFIPLFGDQPRNAAMMEYNGIGLRLSKSDAKDEKKLLAAVQKLLYSKSLHANAKRTAAMLARRPFSPEELLLRHVEFAAEFGASEALHPRGIKLDWAQYFLIDVVAIALLVSSAVVGLVVYCVYRIFRNFLTCSSVKVKRS